MYEKSKCETLALLSHHPQAPKILTIQPTQSHHGCRSNVTVRLLCNTRPRDQRGLASNKGPILSGETNVLFRVHIMQILYIPELCQERATFDL